MSGENSSRSRLCGPSSTWVHEPKFEFILGRLCTSKASTQGGQIYNLANDIVPFPGGKSDNWNKEDGKALNVLEERIPIFQHLPLILGEGTVV